MHMVPGMERVLDLPRLILKPEIPLRIETRSPLNAIAVLERFQAPNAFFLFAPHNNILRQKEMKRLLPQRDGGGDVSPPAERNRRLQLACRPVNKGDRNRSVCEGGIEKPRNVAAEFLYHFLWMGTAGGGQLCAF